MNKYDSNEIIKETLALYENGGNVVPEKLKGKVIIHLYKEKDTIQNGELNGFYQNLFFRLVVFEDVDNPKGRKVYNPERLYDAVFTDNLDVENISFFKDGATCIKFRDKSIYFLDGMACTLTTKNWRQAA